MKKFCLNNSEDLSFLKEVFNILSEPVRIKILCLLSWDKKLCVCEISELLDLKQNLVSHHLSMFKRIGLLKAQRDWVKIYYSLDEEQYNKIKSLIKIILHF